MNTLLTVSRLRRTYGNDGDSPGEIAAHALQGIDLAVRAGEFVSIMGPSGSGKTTLLNLLAGLDTPTAGDIALDGQSYAALDGETFATFRRRRLGFVFQDYNLLDTLTIEENIALPLLLDRQRPGARVRQTMDLLGIAPLANRYPDQVSGGQQQRAAVARAIVHAPSLVLADEPTGNLDSRAAKALLAQFRALNREQGVTILMVTHDPQAASHAGRVVFINDGAVYTELAADNGGRHSFLDRILATLGELEGGFVDAPAPA